MNSYNKVILMGNVGGDVHFGQNQNMLEFCDFFICTPDVWRNEYGQKQEREIWHKISYSSKDMNFLKQNLIQGTLVMIEGKILNENVNGFTSKIIANNVKLIR